MVADIYNTNINVDGKNVFSGSYSLGSCCCGGGMGYMNSCFGFGYGGWGCGLGLTTGFAVGMALTPALPAIFKGIGKGVCWLGNTVAKGVSNLWNNIFHKKSKTKTEKA